jgi:N utilization substance protein A
VGACVGQRGLRVQAISNELGGERIEVVQYDDDPQKYVASALSPAPVVRVDCVADEKTAYVVVPDRYLSLAIGKEGQNARLAAKITGWRIDIRSESEVAAELEPEAPLEAEPVEAEAVAEPVVQDDEAIREDLMVEAEAESAAADESELEDEDRALLGGKKRRDRR